MDERRGWQIASGRMRTCTVDNCSKPHVARGMCENHYSKARYRGEIPRRKPARHGTQNMYANCGCRCDECKAFMAAKRREDRAKMTPKEKRYQRLKAISRAYGISIPEYEQMWERQQGRCAICNEAKDRLGVDHCHTTGRVRELLCISCNAALGLLREDPEMFRRAVEYLTRHGALRVAA